VEYCHTQPARYMVPPGARRLAPRLTESGCGDFFQLAGAVDLSVEL
jgi:hypothetical protein